MTRNTLPGAEVEDAVALSIWLGGICADVGGGHHRVPRNRAVRRSETRARRRLLRRLASTVHAWDEHLGLMGVTAVETVAVVMRDSSVSLPKRAERGLNRVARYAARRGRTRGPDDDDVDEHERRHALLASKESGE